MFHMQERQLSSLFKKPVHNAVRHFSCCLDTTHLNCHISEIIL